jgi:hypothetical protein
MVTVLGIDPGKATGLATYAGGKLLALETCTPGELVEAITRIAPALVVFEDSRLQSPTWGRGVSRAALLKVARNVGQIDGWCALIVEACAKHGIPAHAISPKGKGRKVDADRFHAITGWAARCNQHERDAAMVAWPFRNHKDKNDGRR